ncbi:MAG: type II toxin-antitoxin system HipA family toxin [Deltaproteobacteria bacterium]|nr:type II toxin-antitoxin system HipA family toxin [Deltaproteobacteria bacterium]
MKALSVYMGLEKVGRLECDDKGRFGFQYDPKWISKDNVPPLSLSLPLRKEVYDDESARPFFTNLLPESALREAVARKLGISPRNEFALLAALGGECAGAVSLLPPDTDPVADGDYRELSEDELHKIVRELPNRPFLAGEEGIRLSLAGAQDKLPVYMKGNRIFIPRGSFPSSHILKPNIKGIDGSVRNEVYCMALAAELGLQVPSVTVKTGLDELFVVDRYDRCQDESGNVYRLHQEDFCQASGLVAETKYETEGGPSFADCFKVLEQYSTSPALDRKKLLEWTVFNTLIHNADAHAKNISLLLLPDEIRLAPFYDLLCTKVYEGVSEKLAMKIGGENRPQWIQLRHWERFAEAVGIGSKLVIKTVSDLTGRINSAAREVADAQSRIWGDAPVVHKILRVIATQVRHVEQTLLQYPRSDI